MLLVPLISNRPLYSVVTWLRLCNLVLGAASDGFAAHGDCAASCADDGEVHNETALLQSSLRNNQIKVEEETENDMELGNYCRTWCYYWHSWCQKSRCSACRECGGTGSPTGWKAAPIVQRRMLSAADAPIVTATSDCPSEGVTQKLVVSADAPTIYELPQGKTLLASSVDMGDKTLVIPYGSELIFSDTKELRLTAREIVIHGKLIMGSPSCRIQEKIGVTLTGQKSTPKTSYKHEFGAKGIVVEDGGSLEMFGRRPFPTWTRLLKIAKAGERFLFLTDTVDWHPGDEIVIMTTIYKDELLEHQNEKRTIAEVHGDSITLTEPLKFLHYAGEYSAEVALLSRSIMIQGDTGSEQQQYGGHTICLRGAHCKISGVRAHRMGQKNVMGRYPFHLHMMGDIINNESFFEDNTVDHSFFRAFTIHGTHHANIFRNVAYDITGNAYYLEDGIEQFNNFFFNLAAHVHMINQLPDYNVGHPQVGVEGIISDESRIVPSDAAGVGFYCTNANNRWVGNTASGGFSGFGFPDLPAVLGESYAANPDYVPSDQLLLEFDSNTAHSSGWLWKHHGSCVYIGGKLWEEPKGSHKYSYTYGRAVPNRYAGKYIFTNLKTAACRMGVVFWGSQNDSPEPHLALRNWESHDMLKAAHLMGETGIDGAIWTGHTQNAHLGDFGSLPLPENCTLFEMYDLDMQTVLNNIHVRGLYRDADVAFMDVTNSVVLNSLISLSGITFDPSIKEQHRFRHVPWDHCTTRNLLWNTSYSPCKGTVEQCYEKCPGTSSGSQEAFWEITDGSEEDFPGGSILGGADSENETTGTNDWWLFDDTCKLKYNNEYSSGFWACPTYGHRRAVGLSMQIGTSKSGYAGHDDEIPDRLALYGTMYHFGHKDRRNRLQYGMSYLAGPCCDVGWYLVLDDGALPVFSIFPRMLVETGGLIFSTSYPANSFVEVKECVRGAWTNTDGFGKECKTLPTLAGLQELQAKEGAAYFVDSQWRLFLKMVNPIAMYFDIGGIRQPRRGRKDLWYELFSTLSGPVEMSLPDALA